MQVVFYGNHYGHLGSKLIRWWTSSTKDKFNGKWRDSVSHCEILFSDGMMFSASQYENTTRFKKHSMTGKAWIRLPLSVTSEEEIIVRSFCESQIGKKYDYLGVFGFVFKNADDPDKEFCSEVSTKALQQIGLVMDLVPSKTSPNALHLAITELISYTK